MFNFESIFCLSYEVTCMREKYDLYGNIKLLELCEWAASKIFSINIGYNIANIIRGKNDFYDMEYDTPLNHI